MKKIRFAILAIVTMGMLALNGCVKEPEVVTAVPEIEDEIFVSESRTVISGHYVYGSRVETIKIHIGMDSDMQQIVTTEFAEVRNDKSFTCSFSNLTPGADYYYCYEFNLALNTYTSPSRQFKNQSH